ERIQAPRQRQHQIFPRFQDAPHAILGRLRIEGKCFGWAQNRRVVDLDVAALAAATDQDLGRLGTPLRREMERSKIGFHLSQDVRGRSYQAHSHGAIRYFPQLPRIQSCERLPDLAEDCKGHGLPEYVFPGARNITLSSCLHCTPKPIRSTGTSREKKPSTVSFDG